ncbi:MAG: hypothetical protein GY808_14420 [Gammaproteobacteria bacterium]|nr:hypothetical protein [Gammaproteobacteria bacterium]
MKISDSVANILREEAALNSRSIAEQAEHWLRLGRIIENSPNFDYQRIKEVLNAETSPDELNAQEADVYMMMLMEELRESTPEIEAAYANLDPSPEK